MANIVKFLQGKKTYISALALALVAILGWWFGALNNTNALAVLSAAGVAAGLGAKSERLAQAVLTELSNVRDAQAQHKPVDVKAIAAEIGKQIAPQVISSVVPISLPGGLTCIYCGQPISANGGVCTDPRNQSAPNSTTGNHNHVFFVPNDNAAGASQSR